MARTDAVGNAWRRAILVVAPTTLFAAFVAHPYLPGRLPDHAAVAAAAAEDPVRWGLVHLGASVASALIILAFLAVRSILREAGEERFSALGVPFVVLGSVLYAVLPGMEFAPLAAVEAGATTEGIAAAQEALMPWFMPVLLLGAFTFAVGALCFARAISVATVANRALTRVVVVALVVMAVSRFVPLAAVQFFVQGAAGLAAFWPLAYALGTSSRTRADDRRAARPRGAGAASSAS